MLCIFVEVVRCPSGGGAEFAGPPPCVLSLAPGTGGCQLFQAWETQSCPPETPMDVMRTCHSLPNATPSPSPTPSSSRESGIWGKKQRHILEGTWGAHPIHASEEGLVSGCGCWGAGAGPLQMSAWPLPSSVPLIGIGVQPLGLGT